MSQNILITGASGGFGRLFAHTLKKEGHTVFAGMRLVSTRNRDAAAEMEKSGIRILELDVTHDDGVERAVAQMVKSAGGVDVVINNAGVGVLGLQEMFTPEDWKMLFEINVFGVQRVNRAAIPHMRKKKSGLLIHISSLLGRVTLPFMGPYNSSKFALEAMAENYRAELSAFGIESVVVEPGGYGTGFARNLMAPSDSAESAGYGELAEAPKAMMTQFKKNLEGDRAPDPQDVADAVAKLIAMPRGSRPFRTVVDGLGMGTHVERYNGAAEEITHGIYNAFGMGGMLKLKR